LTGLTELCYGSYISNIGNPAIDWDEGYNPERHLNDMLSAIYDLADEERIWLA
jgi:hypothetical protein